MSAVVGLRTGLTLTRTLTLTLTPTLTPTLTLTKYTLGNLLSIGASSFLVGPAKQCRDMVRARVRVRG